MTTEVRRAGRLRHPGLRHPGLRRLLLAQALSQLGFQVMALAVPMVAVLTLGASPLQVSMVAASQTVAFLVVGLPAGALVDRMRRRRVMITSDVVRATLLATVPLAWWAGLLSVGYLCLVAFCVGVLTVFFDVADQSYLPHLVGREHLVTANSRLVRVESLAGVAGPPAGGGLVQLLGAPVALAATVFGFLWSALVVGGIRDDERVPARARGSRLSTEIAGGVRHIVTDRVLRPIVLCSTTLTFFWSMAYAMLLVLLARELRVPAGLIGVLLTVGGVGGLLTTMVAGRVIRALGQDNAIRLSVAVSAPFTLLAALAAADWRMWLVSAASFGFNAGLVVYNVAQVSLRQRIVPDELLGRVNATIRFFAWGARPLGSLSGGAVAELFGVRQAVWAGAIGTSLAFLWLFLPKVGDHGHHLDHESGQL